MHEARQEVFMHTIRTAMLVQKAKGQLMKGLKPQRRPLPGMPIPGSLKTALAAGTPDDARVREVFRDAILLFFANDRVNRVFVALVVVMVFTVLTFGFIIFWAFLGLFLGVDNGWTTPKEVCVDAWRAQHGNATELPASEVPRINGTYVAEDCNLNQWWFNTCVKAFVSLFSYVNFLPIPWRLTILGQVFCSRHPSDAGLDLYGRPTQALYFNIAKSTRRRISVGLNLAWAFHFICVAVHFAYPSYIQGQTMPGSLLQNSTFALSISCQVWAGLVQSWAEEELIALHPGKYPPRGSKYVLTAWHKWRTGQQHGSLWEVMKREFAELREVQHNAEVHEKHHGLTGIVQVLPPTTRKRRLTRLFEVLSGRTSHASRRSSRRSRQQGGHEVTEPQA